MWVKLNFFNEHFIGVFNKPEEVFNNYDGYLMKSKTKINAVVITVENQQTFTFLYFYLVPLREPLSNPLGWNPLSPLKYHNSQIAFRY